MSSRNPRPVSDNADSMTFYAVPGLPWDQEPDYLAACITEAQPGGPTSYTVPRPVGATPTDVTSFQVGHAEWSLHNLPEIMYRLRPTVSWLDAHKTRNPPAMKDAKEQIIRERWPAPGQKPRPLRNFPILATIEKIGTEEPWWFFALLFRLEPGMTYPDIFMRMEYTGRRALQSEQQFKNSINMMMVRTWHPVFYMISWRAKPKHSESNKRREAVLKRLSEWHQKHNTTRGCAPGLIYPRLGEAQGNRIPLPTLKNGQGVLKAPRKVPQKAKSSSNVSGSLKRKHEKLKSPAAHIAEECDHDDTSDDEYRPVSQRKRSKRSKRFLSVSLVVDGPCALPSPVQSRQTASLKERKRSPQLADPSYTIPDPGPLEHITKKQTTLFAADNESQGRKRKYVHDANPGSSNYSYGEPATKVSKSTYLLDTSSRRQAFSMSSSPFSFDSRRSRQSYQSVLQGDEGISPDLKPYLHGFLDTPEYTFRDGIGVGGFTDSDQGTGTIAAGLLDDNGTPQPAYGQTPFVPNHHSRDHTTLLAVRDIRESMPYINRTPSQFNTRRQTGPQRFMQPLDQTTFFPGISLTVATRKNQEPPESIFSSNYEDLFDLDLYAASSGFAPSVLNTTSTPGVSPNVSAYGSNDVPARDFSQSINAALWAESTSMLGDTFQSAARNDPFANIAPHMLNETGQHANIPSTQTEQQYVSWLDPSHNLETLADFDFLAWTRDFVAEDE